MRLKQLLGVLTLLLVFSMAAAAAGSQLTKVSFASQGKATTVTLLASGAFTHNEYRPADNLLLVDLSGVSAGQFDDRAQPVAGPGVRSYRVLGYTGPSGTTVTRFELTLVPGAAIDLAAIPGGLKINVAGKEGTPSADSNVIAETAKAPVETPAARMPAPAKVRNLSVARGDSTLDVQIDGTGALEPRVSKLAHPDRLVVDLINAVPVRWRTIAVNSDGVKGVRMGRFQENPPVTRVVVDLAGAHDYSLSPEGNKVVLKIHVPKPVVAAAPRKLPGLVAENNPPALPNAPIERPALPTAGANRPVLANAAAETAALQKPAGDYVMIEPKVLQVKPASAEAAAGLATAAANPEPKIETASEPSAPVYKPAVNLALQQQQQMAQPKPAATPRYTGEPISVNLKDVDLRDFFRLIHEISGLNIVLDPNVKGSLTLVLDDVPWDQALDIVLKNNALDRQLEGNVLRVATLDTLQKEAEARRKQAEAEALAVDKVTVTRFLSYAHSKDIVMTIKKFLSQRGDVISDDRTNALIIQDIPSVIPEIDRLIQQLDRKTQQVEIEARVVAATRTFARDIGTQLGFGVGSNSVHVGGAPAVGVTPTQVGYINPPKYPTIPGVTPQAPPVPPAIAKTTGAAIPLFTNLAAGGGNPTSGLNLTAVAGTYRLDAILTAAETRGLLKVLSRPRIMTQNNTQAVVRQGIRIPVVTQAQLGGPPTTTWTDAFLRMTVTPQITIENTIFLNIDVENTTPDFSNQVGGNPTLITQQAQTQVLVTDGGTVVIAGVIQTQNSVNTDQVPYLGDIPVLGNLFKRRNVKTSTQELIFFLMPKIIQT